VIQAADYWVVVLAVACGTYLLRASFVLFPLGAEAVERLEPVLRFIPPAALTALIVPAVLVAKGGGTIEIEKPVAAALAVLVAWKTRSVSATLALGMVTYWLVGYLP